MASPTQAVVDRAATAAKILADASAALTASLDIGVTLAAIVHACVPQLGDYCLLDLAEGDGLSLEPIVAHRQPGMEQRLREVRARYPVDLAGPHPVAVAFRTRQADFRASLSEQQVMELNSYRQNQADLPPALQVGARLTVPLVVGGRLLGVWSFAMTDSRRTYDEHDRAVVEELAGRAATALEHARLFAAEQAARREAERQVDRMARLQELTAFLASLREADGAVAREVERALRSDGAVGVVLYVVVPSAGVLELRHGVAPDVLAALAPGPRVAMADESLLATAARTGTPLWPSPDESDFLDDSPAVTTRAYLPLQTGRGAIGVLAVLFDSTQPVAAGERSFQVAIADQVAQMLERIRLVEAERRAAERAGRLERVSTALGRALSREEVATHVLRQAMSALRADAGACRIVTEDGRGLLLLAEHGTPDFLSTRFNIMPLDFPAPIATAARLRQPVWHHRRAELVDAYPESAVVSEAIGSESMVALPLLMEERLVGTLALHFIATPVVGDEEMELAQALANQCAVALDRARLYQAEQVARWQAEQLQHVTAALAECTTEQDVVHVAVTHAREALRADSCSLIGAWDQPRVLGQSEASAEALQQRSERLERGVAASNRVLASGEPLWYSRRSAWLYDFPSAATVASEQYEARAFLPMNLKGRTLGALSLLFERVRDFSPAERATMLALAGQCAQALERVRLFSLERRAREEADRLLGDVRTAKALADQIMTTAPGVIYVFDLMSQSNSYATREIASILGFSADDLRAMGPSLLPSLLHEDDAPAVRARLADVAAAANGQVIQHEYRMRHRDGSYRWLLSRETPFARDSRGVVTQIIGTAMDVTADRQRSDRAARLNSVAVLLSESLTPEEVGNAVVNAGVVGVGARSGVVVLRERDELVAIAWAGVEQEVVRSWARFSIHAPAPLADAARTATPIFLRSAAEWAALYAEADQNRAADAKSWAALPMIVDGECIGGIGFSFALERVFDDEDRGFLQTLAQQAAQAMGRARLFAAEREARQQAQEASRHVTRLRDLAVALSSAVTLTDVSQAILDHGLRALDAAAGTVRLLTDDGDALALLDARNVPEDQVTAWRRQPLPLSGTSRAARVFHTGEIDIIPRRSALDGPVPEGEQRIARLERDGTSLLVPLVSSGRTMGVLTAHYLAETAIDDRLGLLQDIAAQAAHALDRALLYHAANTATRLKSEFLATMSHEIRTPMNGVLGLVDVLLESPLSDDQRELTETIRSSGESLLTLLNDVLDFSKIESGKLEVERTAFALHHVLDEVLELMAEPAERKGLALEAIVHPGLPRALVGDPGRLRQVITNLVSNAVKFTERGSVTVRCRALADHAGTTWLTVAVTDTGIGIEPTAKARIFEAFRQADGTTTRRYGGTGLGLSISQRLVQLMGGTLHVESVVDAGSTFSFRLPLEAAASGVPTGDLPVLAGRRILVATARPTTAEAAVALVEAWGGSAVVASDAPAALAAGAGDVFDLVLLDLAVPGVAAPGWIAGLLGQPGLVQAPCLGLTPFGWSERWEHGLPACLAGTTSKPLRAGRLASALLSILAPGEEAPGSEHDNAPTAAAPSLGRVLVAEDHPVNQRVLCRLLEHLGCVVDMVPNGREAVVAAQTHSYDLILMDGAMPEMDGLEATRAIRDQEVAGRHVPIVAVTASALAEDRQRFLAAGMDDHVAKPVSLEALTMVLRRWLTQGNAGDSVAEALPVIDATVTRRLATIQAIGTEDIYTELASIFLEDAPRRLAALRVACVANDGPALARLCHGLRGSAATIGGARVVSACQAIERAAAADGAVAPQALFERLVLEVERLCEALAALRTDALLVE